MARRRRPLDQVSDVVSNVSDALVDVADELLGLGESTPKVRDWDSLSAAQRRRYEGAGRTGKLTGTPGLTLGQVRRYYESGGNLSGGRGYHPPKNAAPRTATVRTSTGVATAKDLKDLRQWRKTKAPKWLPSNDKVMADDTAAILSQIGTHPRNWRRVEISRNPRGDGFIMKVTTKRGAVRMVLLPDRSSVSEVATLLRNREGQGRTKKERAQLKKEWSQSDLQPHEIDVKINDTDPESMRPAPTDVPTTRVGNALPRQRRNP